jgi:hypothetical protein
MRRLLSLIALASTYTQVAIAQPVFATEFPAAASPLSPEALTKLVADKVFKLKPATGPEIRVEYRGNWAYFNAGNASDNGKWRIEGSAVCVEWKRIPPGCSEMRMVGDTLYTKRASNGEVLPLLPN